MAAAAAMEAQTAPLPPPSDSSSSAYPRWVMLEQYCRLDDDSAPAAGDVTTLAAGCTSTGHLIKVSLRIDEPPLATPIVRIQVPDGGGCGGEVEEHDYAVVAAHADCLLIRVDFEEKQNQQGYTTDFFVYNAGDAATDPPRPPSLSLLPPCCMAEPKEYMPEKRLRQRLSADSVLGILRRRGDDDDELVVVVLRTPRPIPALRLFRSGKWSVKRVPISYSDFDGDVNDGDESSSPSHRRQGVHSFQPVWEQVPSVWNAVVIPVGDQRLCWVHLSRGVMVICDNVFDENPRLWYLRLPMEPSSLGLHRPWNRNRNVCATAGEGGDALKFVGIVCPRSACGGADIDSGCESSRHSYTIHTWTLRIDGDHDVVEWVKDGMIDCTELWALNAYKGLPCVPLDHPVVSMEESHVIYFQLCERRHVKVKHGGEDDALWLLKVDMRSKTIQSISRYEDDGFPYRGDTLFPCNVSNFFNSYQASK